MKELGKSVFFILIFGIILAISYFYTPSSVKVLNEKINQSNPVNVDVSRLNLIDEYGSALARNLPENNPMLYFYWYSNQRKLSDLRVKHAIGEIKNSRIEAGQIRIWSLLNMGVVIKTGKQIIAVDTANLPFSQAHNELADMVDIFIVTHMDNDHYDSSLLEKALKKQKNVVVLDGFDLNSISGGVVKLASGGEGNFGDIKITAYQTDHRGDGEFFEPSAWFIIELGGFKLLHTGDGRDFKNKDEANRVYAMKDFDILLGNNAIHPYNVRDLKPKVFLPLHLYKYMSGNDLYQESTIEAVSERYRQYENDMRGINKIFLLPGESFTYDKDAKI